jgi:hypothetical protein
MEAAKEIAEFSLPLMEKLIVLQTKITECKHSNITIGRSLRWAREALHIAESNYHKGARAQS